MAKIEVGTKVKEVMERHALQVCKLTGAKPDSFTQDMNAFTVLRALVELKVIPGTIVGDNVVADLEPAMKAQVLQVLKKGGNASALRQAIMDDKAADKVSELVADYGGLG